MRPFLHIPRVHRCDGLFQTAFAARLVTTCLVFACILSVTVWVYSVNARAVLTPMSVDLSPGVDLAWSSGAMEGQMAVGLGDVKINVEAYNRKREKDIADASRKLLLLAISLKSDLDHNPGSELSPDAIKKAKQIEKLARDVKETMKINVVGPQDHLEIR